MTLPTRLYRTLLFLFPAEFRDEYGGQMEGVFKDRLAGTRGIAGAIRFCCECLWDIFRSAPREHLDVLRADVRHGLRSLRRSRSFTATVVAALAAGIGINTAIFSVAYGILLKPLPYPDPDRLVVVTTSVPNHALQASLGPDFASWKAQSRSLDQVAVYTESDRMLLQADGPAPVNTAGVTPELFTLLGAHAEIGRRFNDADVRPGAPGTALISHAAWQSRFRGDKDAVGREITLDDESFRIIGILPAIFAFPAKTEIWLPNREDFVAQRTQTRIVIVNVIGHLRPGVSRASAESELTSIAVAGWNDPGVMPGHKEMLRGLRVTVTPLAEVIVGNTRPQLMMLAGAVVLVLAIACVNASNLQLARAATRHRDVAVRLALGAGWSRLVRHVLTESLLLAAAGGALGTALAFGLLRLLMAVGGGSFPRAEEVGISWVVLGFTAAVSTLTGLVFGLAPALFAARTPLNDALKDGVRGGGGSAWPRLRSGLVSAQLAVALILLAGAGLLARSFVELRQVNPGFNPRNLLIAQVSLVNPAYQKAGQSSAFHREALRRLSALPGVDSVGLNPDLPINSSFGTQTALAVEGHPFDPKLPLFGLRHVNADYFRALRIPLVAGRMFTETDMVPGSKSVMVNEALARLYFTPREAVGKRLQDQDHRDGGITIVGVVGDVRHRGLHAAPMPEVYAPYVGTPFPRVSYAIRTRDDPRQMIDSVRAAIRAVDGSAGVHSLTTMEERVNGTFAQRRFQMLVLVAFAALAAGLAGIGVYGVTSYAVAQRTHEIGVRKAMGAAAMDIATLVMRQTLLMAAIGLAIGMAASWWTGRAISGLLFGVRPMDPLVLAGAAAMLLAVAALGSLGPAWRAASLDPALTLRRE